jgi:hypothetical protein
MARAIFNKVEEYMTINGYTHYEILHHNVSKSPINPIILLFNTSKVVTITEWDIPYLNSKFEWLGLTKVSQAAAGRNPWIDHEPLQAVVHG